MVIHPRPGPIWWVDPEIMYAEDSTPTSEELEAMKSKLQIALSKVEEKYAN